MSSRFFCYLLPIVLVLATHVSGAHPVLDGYVPCADTKLLPAVTGEGYPRIGVRNKCNYDVIGVVCVEDKYTGQVRRYEAPVNLPPGHLHAWTLWDKSAYSSVNSYTCEPSSDCHAETNNAGTGAHDPHCH